MDYHFLSTEDREASQNPFFVMVDEKTGCKFARAVGTKGLGPNGEHEWLLKEAVNELKNWGHTGG